MSESYRRTTWIDDDPPTPAARAQPQTTSCILSCRSQPLRPEHMFAAWRREGVVCVSAGPYWLEQHARGPDGVRRRRRPDRGAAPELYRTCRRHERTLDAPKAGPPRRAAGCACEPLAIFMAYATRRAGSATSSSRSSPTAPRSSRPRTRRAPLTGSGACARIRLRAAIQVVGSRPLTVNRTATAVTRRRSPIATSAAPPTACLFATRTWPTATTRVSCLSHAPRHQRAEP